MSITDELRHEVANYPFRDNRDFALFEAIADRIDAAYKHAIGYVDDRDPETMAENGWMKLPKDAEGEYIHIGDLMAYADNTKPMEVVALVPPAVFLTEDGPRYADMCRHYHAPTVEDVLREFAEKMNQNLGMYTGEAIDDDEWRDADNKTIAKYAKRLTLAEVEDA